MRVEVFVDDPDRFVQRAVRTARLSSGQAITNALDSAGELHWFEENPRPREIVAEADRVRVLGAKR